MASIMTIRLNKNPGSSWGFRLQGGKDFATPLCIQKVNVGSVAEQAGLQAGDAIVSINNSDALAMRHKEAQDAIVKAGNNFELVVQRGSQIWKPAVTALPETKILSDGVPVATKTSLAANQKTERKIGSNYNCVPRPFPGSFNKSASPSSTFKTNSSPYSEIIEETKSENTNGFYSSTPQSFRKNSVDKKSSTVTSHPIFNIDEATLDLTISGTGITLDKEKAKNFLIMTLDKENNVNTINLHKSSNKEFSPVNGNINGNSFRSNGNLSHTNISGTSRSPSNSSICSSNSLAGRGVRKLSYGSNCSSVSSASSHDGDNESTNIYQKDLVNAQYNSPVNIYSEDSIAETLSAQAEVLGKGVLGVNFMKNDRSYDGRASDVLRMVHEMDKEPQIEAPGTPTHVLGTHDKQVAQGYSFKLLQRALDYEATPPPQNFQSGQSAAAAPSSTLQPGDNICYSCQTLITGVFVRIKNKNLHADCFKCSTCGSSLKNVGYYSINDKLYCDIHAKQAARSNPPAPNLVPVTVQPGAAPPPGVLTAPQASKMKIPSAFQQGGPAFAPAPAPAPAPPQTEVQQSEPQELPEPLPAPVFESTHIQSAVSEVSSQSHLSSQIVENEGVVLPPILNGDTFTSQERAPAPAPAPVKPFAPAPAPAPVAAPVKPASAPSYSTSANPQGFGAPAGDINVRAHIPKKVDDVHINPSWPPHNFVPEQVSSSPTPYQIPKKKRNIGKKTFSQQSYVMPLPTNKNVPLSKPAASSKSKGPSFLTTRNKVKSPPRKSKTQKSTTKSTYRLYSDRFPNPAPSYILKFSSITEDTSTLVSKSTTANLSDESQLYMLKKIGAGLSQVHHQIRQKSDSASSQIDTSLSTTTNKAIDNRSREHAKISPIRTKPITDPLPTINSTIKIDPKAAFEASLKKYASNLLSASSLPKVIKSAPAPKLVSNNKWGFKPVKPPNAKSPRSSPKIRIEMPEWTPAEPVQPIVVDIDSLTIVNE